MDTASSCSLSELIVRECVTLESQIFRVLAECIVGRYAGSGEARAQQLTVGSYGTSEVRWES
jgi:hypothetical protein